MSTAISSLKKILQEKWFLIFFFVIASLLGLSAVYVSQGDILYDADIARDFLLYQEILEKGFVLIGPRSGAAQGFFHGPLWSYLNFPAFYLGSGNPVSVGWFWVLLNIFFVGSTFWLGRKFLGKLAGYLAAVFVAVPMIGFTRAFFNPSGALVIMPIFLGTFLLFIKTRKIVFLFFHALLIGVMIQFQIAVGGPFLILSTSLLIGLVAKRQISLKSLLILPAAGLPLFTYLLFDIRHGFTLVKAVISYTSGTNASVASSLTMRMAERLGSISSSGTFFLPPDLTSYSPIIFWTTVGLALYAIVRKRDLLPAFFLYFYIGFYALSLFHRGGWAVYYFFPVFPVVYLALVAGLRHFRPVLFVLIIALLALVQLRFQITSLGSDLELLGKRQYSWQFHNNIAKVVFDNARQSDFGFFLYSPDVQGYRSKYPMIYQQRLNPKKVMHLYEKLPETFVLLAGPPEYELPWEPDPRGFVNSSLRIAKKPSSYWSFPWDYKIERFELSNNEVSEPFDRDINNWLLFR